jgi:chemotaxis signal transduction protein
MIPVVDFRMMLGAEPEADLPEASIIIVSIDGTNETLVGFKVDEVDEVFDYNPENVSNDVVLEVSKLVQPSLRGMLQDKDKFVYLINLDVLSKELEK